MKLIARRISVSIIILLLLTFPLGALYSKGGDSDNVVYLKEHFATVLNAHIRQDELRFQMLDRALVLHAAEVERRLEMLNQLRGEVTTDRSLYLRKETYDASLKEWTNWRDTVNQKLTEIETRVITYVSVLGFIVLILNLVMRWFPKHREGDQK